MDLQVNRFRLSRANHVPFHVYYMLNQNNFNLQCVSSAQDLFMKGKDNENYRLAARRCKIPLCVERGRNAGQ